MTPTAEQVEVDVEGRRLRLSNLGKLLYPEAGFTKGQVIDYYTRIAPVLTRHLSGRPLTLKRYPNGVDGSFFFEKNCPKHRPDWIATASVWSSRNKENIDYCLIDDTPGLVWLANLAALELHPSLSRTPDIDCPTVLAFDLDPGPPATVVECARVALLLKEVFDGLGLSACPKTSGSKGLQIYVPLNTPATYDKGTTDFAHALAQRLEAEHPKDIVSRMSKDLRPGKVFIDWSQNNASKTTISVYSLRARPRPTVSTPVTWDEVEAVADSGDGSTLVFEAATVLERVKEHGDLFAPVLDLKQSLPAEP